MNNTDTVLALFLVFVCAMALCVNAQTAVPMYPAGPTPSRQVSPPGTSGSPRPSGSPQTSSSPQPSSSTNPCPQIYELSSELDSLLYTSDTGSALDAQRVNWTQVATYTAPTFVYQDYTYFNSAGNYTDYQTYWEALNAVYDRWPLINATNDWVSCDPINRRYSAQWKETYGSATDPSLQETSTSIYVYEYDPDLKVTRQAYWTSSNIADLLATASAPAASPI